MSQNSGLFDLTGKVALITGGNGGIGRAIAEAFVDHGAHVLVGARDESSVERVAREIDERDTADDDPSAAGIVLDVTSDASVDRAVRRAIDLFGRLDVLVNAAGTMKKRPTSELTIDEFRELQETHLTGSLRCAQSAGHVFREQHGGCIINLASASSFVDLVEVTAYAAAKNGVVGLTRSLANEWAKYGIRTNAIAPGFVPTELNRSMIEGTDRGRRILEGTPMGRFGTPDEIAASAVFLAAPAASYVNGHTLVVDGGFLACGVGDAVAPWEEDEA